VNETMIKMRILAHAEYTLARVNMRRLANRAILTAIAVGLILLVLVLVNVGAYALLAESYGYAKAAFVLAVGNGVLAALVLFVAGQSKPGPEEEMVREIREMTLAELSADAEGIKTGFANLVGDVKGIQSRIAALGGGLGAGLSSLGPLIGLLVEALKKRRQK